MPRPNLLFLMPDQLRHDFLGCYGADFAETPNIDGLADHGVLYRNAYSPSPICVPARSLLMTGVNAIRTGVLGNGEFLRPDLEDCGIRTWPQHLADAGYTTAAIGKMHFYPWDLKLGFQYRVAAEDKRWIHIEDDYQRFLKRSGYRKLHGNEHDGYQDGRGAIVNRIPWEYSVDRFVGQETCRFIRELPAEETFAAMVGFPGPHCPYDPNQEFLDGVDESRMPPAIPVSEDDPQHLVAGNVRGNKSEWNGVDYAEFTDAHKRKIRAHYTALVQQIDHEIGDILNVLEETGRLDNTVIIFGSDHGDYLGDHGLIGKGTFLEASTHVPLIVRTPGQNGGRVSTEPASIEDITATLLSLGGVEPPGYMDSKPLPELGIPGSAPRDIVFGFLAGGCMAFDGEWKLIKYASGQTRLYNIPQDPGEQKNRLDERRDIADRLDAALTTKLFQSLRQSNREKTVDDSTGLWQSEAFGRLRWKRRYPQPLDNS